MLETGCEMQDARYSMLDSNIQHTASAIYQPAPMLFGILNANKPSGLSSRKVVDQVERHVRPARCGHAGTLDPLASGVLVICVGPATRLIPYVQRMPKSYRATFLLDQSSLTDDVESDITHVAGAPEPTAAQIAAVLPQFAGTIQQRPPVFSAVKVAGRRAYALARRGKAVELAPRPVTIYRLAVTRYNYPELELHIECGSGTYVRSLGRDLAAALGTSAIMSALVRTAIGGFRVENSVQPDELSAINLAEHLQPPLAAVADLPRVTLNDEQLAEIRYGRPIAKPSESRQPRFDLAVEWAAIDSTGRLAAILIEKRPSELWPARNFV
jgi:tRNA pseudouridine55 synthase